MSGARAATNRREAELLLTQALWSGEITRVDEAIRAGANLNSPSTAPGKRGEGVVSAFLSEYPKKDSLCHIPDGFLADLVKRGLKIASLPEEERYKLLFLIARARTNFLTPALLEAIDREDTSPENVEAAQQNLLLLWAKFGKIWEAGAKELVRCWGAKDINASDEEGRTALILFAERNCLEFPFLRTFMSCGADVYVTDKRGRTAFSILLERGSFDDIWSGFLELFAEEEKNGTNTGVLARNSAPGVERVSPIKRALPCLVAVGLNTTIPAEMLVQNGLDHSQESTIALLLSALLLPERNESLFDMAGFNLVSSIAKIGGAVEEGARRGQGLPDSFAEKFLKTVHTLSEHQVSIGENWYSNKYSRKVSAGLVKILLQGIESSTDSALCFLRDYARESLGEWVRDGIEGAEELMSRVVSRETSATPQTPVENWFHWDI